MATAAAASTTSTGHISLDAALRYRRDATELLKTPPAKTGDAAADEAAALSHTRKALQWFQLGRQNCMETINSLRQEKQLRDEEEAQKKKAADAEAAKVAAAKAAAAPPPQRPAAAAVAPPPPAAVPRGPSLSAPSLSAPSMASRYGSSSGASSKSADLSSGLGLPQLMPTLSDPAPVTATPSATVEPPQASPPSPPPPAAPVAVPATATATSVASAAPEEAPAKTENDAMMKLFNSGGQKGLSGEHRALALDNFLACTSNATMLLLKLNKFSDAVRLANEVLEFDPKNAKALYRKGVATVSMGSADEGLKFLRLALEQAPGDGGILAAIENAQQQVVQQDQRAKATYAKMLSGASR